MSNKNTVLKCSGNDEAKCVSKMKINEIASREDVPVRHNISLEKQLAALQIDGRIPKKNRKRAEKLLEIVAKNKVKLRQSGRDDKRSAKESLRDFKATSIMEDVGKAFSNLDAKVTVDLMLFAVGVYEANSGRQLLLAFVHLIRSVFSDSVKEIVQFIETFMKDDDSFQATSSFSENYLRISDRFICYFNSVRAGEKLDQLASATCFIHFAEMVRTMSIRFIFNCFGLTRHMEKDFGFVLGALPKPTFDPVELVTAMTKMFMELIVGFDRWMRGGMFFAYKFGGSLAERVYRLETVEPVVDIKTTPFTVDGGNEQLICVVISEVMDCLDEATAMIVSDDKQASLVGSSLHKRLLLLRTKFIRYSQTFKMRVQPFGLLLDSAKGGVGKTFLSDMAFKVIFSTVGLEYKPGIVGIPVMGGKFQDNLFSFQKGILIDDPCQSRDITKDDAAFMMQVINTAPLMYNKASIDDKGTEFCYAIACVVTANNLLGIRDGRGKATKFLSEIGPLCRRMLAIEVTRNPVSNVSSEDDSFDAERFLDLVKRGVDTKFHHFVCLKYSSEQDCWFIQWETDSILEFQKNLAMEAKKHFKGAEKILNNKIGDACMNCNLLRQYCRCGFVKTSSVADALLEGIFFSYYLWYCTISAMLRMWWNSMKATYNFRNYLRQEPLNNLSVELCVLDASQKALFTLGLSCLHAVSSMYSIYSGNYAYSMPFFVHAYYLYNDGRVARYLKMKYLQLRYGDNGIMNLLMSEQAPTIAACAATASLILGALWGYKIWANNRRQVACSNGVTVSGDRENPRVDGSLIKPNKMSSLFSKACITSSLDQLLEMVSKCSLIVGVHSGSELFKARGFVIGDTIFTVAHMIPPHLRGGGELRFVFYHNFSMRDQILEPFTTKQYVVDPGRDLLCILVPLPTNLKLLRFFPSSEFTELDGYNGMTDRAYMITYNEDTKEPDCFGPVNYKNRIGLCPPYDGQYADVTGAYSEFYSESSPGHSGSLIVAQFGNYKGIVGMLIASSRVTSLCIQLTEGVIKDLRSKLNTPKGVTIEFDGETKNDLGANSILRYKSTNAITIGEIVPFRTVKTTATAAATSLGLHEVFCPILEQVSGCRYGQGLWQTKNYETGFYGPYHKALDEGVVLEESFQFPEYVFEQSCDLFLSRLHHRIEVVRKTYHPFSVDVAINGGGGLNIKSMDVNKAAGYPYSGLKEELLDMYIREDGKKLYTLRKDIEAEFLKTLAHLSDEHFEGSYVVRATVKNEVRKMTKWARVFYASPFVYFLISKMFLSPIFEYILDMDEISWCAIGVSATNPVSWSHLQKRIFKFDFVCEGDYQSFDVHHTFQAMRILIYRVMVPLAEMLGYSKEEILIVERLLIIFMHAVVVMQGNVFVSVSKNPSGCCGTTEINSILNLLYIITCFKILCPGAEFYDKVSGATYGDDVLFSVHPSVASRFNLVTIAPLMRSLNQILTDSKKSAVLQPFVDPKSATFVKRQFRIDLKSCYYLAPLDEVSLYRSLSYLIPSKSVSRVTQSLDIIRSANFEMFFHGEHQLDWFLQLVKPILSDYPEFRLRSYSELYEWWISGEGSSIWA